MPLLSKVLPSANGSFSLAAGAPGRPVRDRLLSQLLRARRRQLRLPVMPQRAPAERDLSPADNNNGTEFANAIGARVRGRAFGHSRLVSSLRPRLRVRV